MQVVGGEDMCHTRPPPPPGLCPTYASARASASVVALCHMYAFVRAWPLLHWHLAPLLWHPAPLHRHLAPLLPTSALTSTPCICTLAVTSPPPPTTPRPTAAQALFCSSARPACPFLQLGLPGGLAWTPCHMHGGCCESRSGAAH